MKKNLFLLAVAAGGAMLATSCASDEPAAIIEEGGVSFTVQLPNELQSRAFGDGQSAKELSYVVYEADQSTPLPIVKNADGTLSTVGKATFPEGALETTVNIDLPRGKKYDIIFFAKNASENSPYTLDENQQTFEVDYTKMTASSEDYDAFVRALEDFSITGPTSTTVTLYRPFAQLNIGTTDLEVALNGKMDIDNMTVTTTDVYTKFDFLGGSDGMGKIMEASKVTEPVTFTAARPTGETFPYVQTPAIDYLTMQYLLVPTQKSLIDVTFRVAQTDYQTLSFTNVPVQRNHRTNIWGALLTSPAEFNVVINPMFDDPDYNNGDYSNIMNINDFTDAIQKGGKFRLESDIDVAYGPYVSAWTTPFTINLNGHTLNNTMIAWRNGGCTIEGEGNVVLDDHPWSYPMFYLSNQLNGNTIVNLNGGTYTCPTQYLAIVQAGVVNINGGTFNTPNGVNVSGTGKVVIKGGTFNGWNPSAYVAPGYKVEADGTTYTVVAE